MPVACTEVTPSCPVEATIYGYSPVLWANSALLAVFAVTVCAQLALGLTTKVYSYSIAIGTGCLTEAIGYIGRILLHNNVWNGSGFKMQLVCLIIAPSFLAAGIYLTLKHIILRHGPQYSKLKPNLYTWVFIGCDLGSILLQAAGGALANTAFGNDPHLLDVGNSIIVAGIAVQVATMVVCGLLAVDFFLRQHRHRSRNNLDKAPREAGQWKSNMFQAAVGIAFVTVLIRSIYRLPEMAGGWGNTRMRNEEEFLILDGLMVAVACIILTIFHPAFFFPAMRTGHAKQEEADTTSTGGWAVMSDLNPTL